MYLVQNKQTKRLLFTLLAKAGQFEKTFELESELIEVMSVCKIDEILKFFNYTNILKYSAC